MQTQVLLSRRAQDVMSASLEECILFLPVNAIDFVNHALVSLMQSAE